MKYRYKLSGWISIGLLVCTGLVSAQEMMLFVGKGCGSCAQVEDFLERVDLPTDQQLVIKDVYTTPEDAELFTTLCDQEHIPLLERSVPMLFTQDRCLFGEKNIITYLESVAANAASLPLAEISSSRVTKGHTTLSLPLVIGAALIDAINPCAFAVLIILLTTLLITSTRRKALRSGIAFSVSIFLSYLLMGLGVYHIISNIGTSPLFLQIIARFAIFLGLRNLKDYVRYGQGMLLEVPLSRRPKLRQLLEKVASPIGAFFTGFLVSLFLLPCTSGPYVVIISMLGHAERASAAFGYLVLYNLVFILPMIIITLAVARGLDIDKVEDLRQAHLRALHLIAGLLLITIGSALLVF